jgi:hypothetical protein
MKRIMCRRDRPLQRFNLRIGRISQWLAPGYSWCGRCKTNWAFVKSHDTEYSRSGGCFPLCEKCWRGLTPAQRLPYYRDLWQEWYGSEPDVRRAQELLDRWDEIKLAVISGG